MTLSSVAAATTTTRVQGRATARKMMHPQEQKRVTWSPVEAVADSKQHYLDSSDVEKLWHSPNDLREIRISNEMQVVMSSHDGVIKMNKSLLDQEEDVMRGLETWTEMGAWERFESHRDCLNKVLDEQDRQKGIDKSYCQNTLVPLIKRISHLHIPFDHDRLAALCRDATAKARRNAMLQGKKDYTEALSIKDTVEKVPPTPKPAPKAKQATFSRSSDHTISTEAMTHDSSNESVNTATAIAPQVEEATQAKKVVEIPLSIDIPLTLQQKQKARLARYKANLSERVAAREKREYEWEQRRLARKADIWEEVDANLEQMKRITKLSNELLSLIEASRLSRRPGYGCY